jgi:deoxyribodipyrimidine photo-lyase
LPFHAKIEDECRMEFENVNRAYDTLVKPKMKRISKPGKKEKQAFHIDACMRCLVATGYIISGCARWWFPYTFNLWQDWRGAFSSKTILIMNRIHYPQIQMQSGTTGINTKFIVP